MKREDGWYLYDKLKEKHIYGPTDHNPSPSWCHYMFTVVYKDHPDRDKRLDLRNKCDYEIG